MTPREFKALRNYLDISQSEIARRVGVTQPCIAKIEKGKAPVSEKVKEKAKVFFREKCNEIIHEIESELEFFKELFVICEESEG